MDINEISRSLLACTCGREHRERLPLYRVEAGILDRLPALLDQCGMPRDLHLVSDRQTMAASGNVPAVLERAGFRISQTGFADLRESSLAGARELASRAAAAGGILAIGSGSINDLCRYAAFSSGKPYAILATAPSMDGFTSTVSPLIDGGFKRTHAAVAPRGVFADPAVLAAAPVRLRAAGVGDLLGKFTALADWEACHRLTGEYWCPRIAALVRRATDLACSRAAAIRAGDPAAVTELMDALVLSGFGMLWVGNSRPASGAEHHLSHFWEMRYLEAGRPQEFHGIKVGAATLELAPIYTALGALPVPPPLRPTPAAAAIRQAFGPLAAEVIAENSPDPVAAVDPGRVAGAWPEIRRILAAIPPAATLRGWYAAAGGDAGARDLGIPADWIAQARESAPLVRSRLSVLRLFGPGPW